MLAFVLDGEEEEDALIGYNMPDRWFGETRGPLARGARGARATLVPERRSKKPTTLVSFAAAKTVCNYLGDEESEQDEPRVPLIAVDLRSILKNGHKATANNSTHRDEDEDADEHESNEIPEVNSDDTSKNTSQVNSKKAASDKIKKSASDNITKPASVNNHESSGINKKLIQVNTNNPATNEPAQVYRKEPTSVKKNKSSTKGNTSARTISEKFTSSVFSPTLFGIGAEVNIEEVVIDWDKELSKNSKGTVPLSDYNQRLPRSPIKPSFSQSHSGKPSSSQSRRTRFPSSRAIPATMEPRARVGKNRGQQNFADQDLQHFLFAHGDTPNSLETTKRVLDELLTDFITELCFEAHRSAQLSGRQKIKPDDIKFACRKNPEYLGKINETFNKKTQIEEARKLLDQNDDKITKSNVKAMEEPLGDADDDDIDSRTVGGRSNGTGAGK
ncbi:hypothetical protein IFR05_014901 [Cadophora sp. M221]|nr:hypothetical protein IFR05_014901 [Cadophora sp. M221]